MRYAKLVADDTFIGQYMKHMSYVETAESYDFWCAVWAIGEQVGYDVYVDRPNSPVHLNWYVILTAESGTTRKSTAVISIANLLGANHITRRIGPKNLEQYIHDNTISSGSGTATLMISELVTLLGKESHMNAMPGLLTDLYDCPAIRGGTRDSEYSMRNVYVNLLSASTPIWLVTAVNPSVVEGGLTSRIMFIVDDTRKRSIPWPKERDESDYYTMVHELAHCVDRAKEIKKIGISTGGLRKFTSWYNNRDVHTDPYLSSFEAREDDHVLKLAAILCINDGIMEIQATHISTSIKVIAQVKNTTVKLFGNEYSHKAKVTGHINRVRDVLIKAGIDGISQRSLRQRTRGMAVDELNVLIDIMHECGMIQVFKVGKGRMYRATQSIHGLGITSQVLSKLSLSDD